MTLRLLSWNVRGLNNPRKREVCKNLLKDWKCDVFKKRKYLLLMVLLFGVYGGVLPLIGLFWTLCRLREGLAGLG